MENITDNIFIIRQQMNEIYRLVGNANLYINHISSGKINALSFKTKIETIYELVGLMENELKHLL